jgi:hypothetical protein
VTPSNALIRSVCSADEPDLSPTDVDRETRDLDFFEPSADEVDLLADAVETALTAAGIGVQRERISHGFARLAVTDGRAVTEVDLGADARIRPTEAGPYGPTLSLEEFAADPSLAFRDDTEVAMTRRFRPVVRSWLRRPPSCARRDALPREPEA